MINYAFAYHHSWLATLLTPHQGYYSFLNNLTALAEQRVSVEDAPFVSTYTAFLVQLLPHLIIWGGRSPYWNTPSQRVCASMIIMFNTMNCAIWLIEVTAQFHLSLVAFLLLMEDWHNRSRTCRVTYTLLLAVAGLTGVASCVLAPFFLYKYQKEKTPLGRILVVTLLGDCMFAFIGVVWFALYGELFKDEQRFAFGFHRFLAFYIRGTFGNIFLGEHLAYSISWRQSHLLLLGLLAFGSLCFIFSYSLPSRQRLLFVGSFLLMSTFNLMGSIEASKGQGRYFYAPNVIFLLMVQQSLFGSKAWRRWFALVILIPALGISIYDFYTYFNCYNVTWPKWSDEVEKWREDANHPLIQWPAGQRNHPPSWVVDLRPKVPPLEVH